MQIDVLGEDGQHLLQKLGGGEAVDAGLSICWGGLTRQQTWQVGDHLLRHSGLCFPLRTDDTTVITSNRAELLSGYSDIVNCLALRIWGHLL